MGIAVLVRLGAIVLAAMLMGGAAGWRASLLAEQRPITRFGRGEGLADDYVTSLRQDSRGFLWIGTAGGASRFDGTRFRTYGVGDGRLGFRINAIVETVDRQIWFATNGGGVARFDPGQPRHSESPALEQFQLGESRPENRVNLIVEGADRTIWAATDSGLFARRPGAAAFTRLALLGDAVDAGLFVPDAALAKDGTLWLATSAGLVRHDPASGRTAAHRLEGLAVQSLTHVAIDTRGIVWVTSTEDIRAFRPGPPASSPGAIAAGSCLSEGRPRIAALAAGESCAIAVTDGLPQGRIIALTLTPDDRAVVGTARGGVAEVADGQLRTIDRAHDRYSVTALMEDDRGNLWIGTDAGLMRLARDGFVTYDTQDGLSQRVARKVFGDGADRVHVMTEGEVVHVFDGGRFRGARPTYPPGAAVPTWPASHAPDPAGGWWVPTSAGVCYYRASMETLGTASASRCYDRSNGLPTSDITQVLPDSRGNLWIGTQPLGRSSIARRSADGVITAFDVDGAMSSSAPIAFLEDPDGGIWAGLRDGGVVRCAADRCVGAVQTTSANALLIDRQQRLWIGTSTGLLRVDDRRSATLVVSRTYTEADGLSNRWVSALVEDDRGRLYVGTAVGLDRFDPATGGVRQFSTADGLAAGRVESAHRDGKGRFWFATRQGVSLYEPREPIAGPLPQPLIAAVRAGNRDWPIADVGAASVADVEIPSGDAPLMIEVMAIDSARPLRIQRRLRGLEDWRSADASSGATYAGLAAGNYTFEARTVGDDGTVSDSAVVQFRVLKPAWQRWPALASATVLLLAMMLALHRARVRRLVALERVRTRIASDLHDDIGSNLSRIAVLAEVARRRPAESAPDADGPLTTIAATSRDLVDTMSDIVWAVNPRHDSLQDLVYRMRRFTEDVFGGAGVAATFSAAPLTADLRLEADVRREVYRVLKESVTNIIRHAGAATAAVTLEIERGRLRLTVADNGRGFDQAAVEPGTGLVSMRRRVDGLGGTLAIHSAQGQGTRLVFELPLHPLPAGGTLRDRVAGRIFKSGR